METITVIFEPTGKRGRFKTGTRILDAAEELGVGIRSECGKETTCGKCRIKVVSGSSLLNDATPQEKELLTRQEIQDGYRLACAARINLRDPNAAGAVAVFVPSESRLGFRRIQVKGMEQPVPLEPAIRKTYLTLQKPTISNPVADDEGLLSRLEAATGARGLKIRFEVSKDLANVVRAANWNVTATTWNEKEIIDIEPGDTTGDNYGAAVDIGTSKIVCYLVNLNTGEITSAGMMENPQIQHGEDILSRICYATQNPENRQAIMKLVVDGIDTVIESACKDAGKAQIGRIHEVTVVGNTVMTHLFLGIEPKFLSLAPYVPAVKSAIDVEARRIGLKICPEGNVHVLPCVAGFVGADAVADVIATAIHDKDEMSLLVDVGTNGEVFLGNKQELLACSCAAGPAFEGTQIKYGMKAVAGAIEKVRIKPKTFEVEYETIGDQKPIGICGSAMVDVVAELLKSGIISTRGRFNKETITTDRLVVEQDGEGSGMSFIVAKRDQTAINRDITVSAKDISEIQLAKSALHTGCEILMQKKRIREEDIGHVYIAGAFGNYLNPENAKTIGLIPDIPTRKITFAGNTALAGAKMALTSRSTRGLADRLSRQIKYVELMAEEGFRREFVASILLPHKNLNKYPSVSTKLRKVVQTDDQV
ncbi:MAG: ASKHA domain-containing protein [Promethearchaeati archaeon SRVP18_Atabeyarchaeia-1]